MCFRILGVGAAWMALLAYNSLQTGLYGAIGAAAGPLLGEWFGVTLPWWLVAFGAWALVGALGVLRVDVNGTVLAVLMVAEVAVIVVFDAADLLRRTLGVGIQIETLCEPAVWRTFVDPNQLDSVILNLAINARDAMKGEGKLTFALENTSLGAAENGQRAGEFVRLTVRDTGSGMEPAVLERAFEPFFTTKVEGAGTGLGLSMVYGFVTQSGGHVRLHSTPGIGTTVEVLLPRLRSAPSFEDGQELPPVEGGIII